MKSISSSIRFSACFLVISSLFLTGCASTFSTLPPQTTSVEHYPDCYAPIQKLRDTEYIYVEYFVERMKEGTYVGLEHTTNMVRRASQKLFGDDTPTDDDSTNYFHDRSAAQKEKRLHLEQHMADVEKYSDRMEQTVAAVREAQQCYSQRFDRSVADYKAGVITKEVFEVQYAEINNGMEEASRILQKGMDSGREMQNQIAMDEDKQRESDKKDTATSGKNSKVVLKPKPKPTDGKKPPQDELPTRGEEGLALTLALMEDELAQHSQRRAAMAKTKENI